MSIFRTNMAQGQATQSMAQPQQPQQSQYDPSKSWEYTFTAGPKKNSWSNHHRGDYMTGPDGSPGYFKMKDQAGKALGAQQHFTDEFKDNMPHMTNLLTGEVNDQINQNMGQGLRASRESDSRRGLLYGGMHQGHEGAIRADAAGKMAQSRSDINQGLQSAYEGMQNDTIQTGIDYQQQQQRMQNAIYENAMANMMGRNSAIGGVLGAAGGIAGAYYGSASGPAGAMVGYQAGSQAGKMVG